MISGRSTVTQSVLHCSPFQGSTSGGSLKHRGHCFLPVGFYGEHLYQPKAEDPAEDAKEVGGLALLPRTYVVIVRLSTLVLSVATNFFDYFGGSLSYVIIAISIFVQNNYANMTGPELNGAISIVSA